jgi:hypothetical protein
MPSFSAPRPSPLAGAQHTPHTHTHSKRELLITWHVCVVARVFRLVTTDTASVNRLGQFWVVVLMIVGNFVLLTLPPVFLRLYYFRKHFRTTGLRCKRRVGTRRLCVCVCVCGTCV